MNMATPTPNPNNKILIVGAGIAGLTTAIACALRGFNVTVLEQAPELVEVGAGLQLQPNATRVLHALGLGENLAAIAVKPDALTLREAHTGKLITSVALDKTVDNLPWYQVHRADLQQLLLQRARALGVTVQLGQRVTRCDQSKSGIEVQTANGDTFTADALVCADGVRSTLRDQLFDTTPPVFTGHVCYRGLVDAKKLPSTLSPGGIVGPGRHFVFYYVRNKTLLNFVAQHEEPGWREESWSVEGDIEELRSMYRDWDPQVTAILQNVVKTYKWALYTRPPLAQWHSGRTVLTGDACHPMLPNLASGAAMAIEDGYVLAELLDRFRRDIPRALALFHELRHRRCTRVQRAAEKMASFFHTRNTLERFIRYGAARALTKFAPGIAARKITWTHDYNALTAVDDHPGNKAESSSG